MAFNNYMYPTGYQPYQMPQPQPQQNNTIWVVGENGADSYLVAPGQTVLLWDSTAPVLYLKSADSMGRPSKKILDYTVREEALNMPKLEPQRDFASKDDIENLKAEIEALRAKLGDMKGEVKK